MIIGQVVHAPVSSKATYYSPWMPVKGNLAVISCEVVDTANMSTFTVTVQTKTKQQSDASAGSFVPQGGATNAITLTAETITKFNVGAKLSDAVNNGFEELFRFKYDATGSATAPAWVHFRMLNVAWLDN